MMTAEETTTSADVENPSPSAEVDGTANTNNPNDSTYANKKYKVYALSAFLLAAVALSIGLGVSLGGNGSDSSSNVSTEDDVVTNNPIITTDDVSAPKVYKARYLEQNGPIQAQVRIIDPSVVDGYNSCDELRDDIENALKHYANTLIVRESENDWYEKCDPNATNWWGVDDNDIAYNDAVPLALESVSAEDSSSKVEAAPQMAADEMVGEDSYETNNQVDGVDEADVAKSDGAYVYAAYGDLLYVWNATDGTQGLSITEMPYEKINMEECKQNNPGHPFMTEEVEVIDEVIPKEEVVEVEATTMTVVEAEASLGSTESTQGTSDSTEGGEDIRKRHHRKASFVPGYFWDPCRQPKPRILSLLLHESRLTAIVSEENNRFGYYYKNEEDGESKPDPIIDDYNKLTIRVYDVSDVPSDGSPLKLLGERQIKGNYKDARSVNSKGVLMTTSNVNMYNFAGGQLYRHNPQYCGLNSSEYQTLAAETALNNTQSFVDQMLAELQLSLDGTCDTILRVAAMQSGNNTKDATYDGNMLGQFVQVSSFDMSSDFDDETISVDVAGGFSSGWLESVYASTTFVSTQSLGSNYNEATGDWDQSTFILGFDISGDSPTPFCYGEVPGHPINQYSVDLYDGHLRVATTESRWSETDSVSRTTNKISVLKLPNIGAELSLVGETEAFGKPNESIFAVRFMGEQAYVVTFLRTDPFYVFNLTDHSNPTILGELSIPGFSEYLHPIELDGAPFMLGLGRDVNETTGREIGVKISLFNVSSPTNLTENAVFVDKGAYSSAGNDYKSFRYLPQSKKLIIPKSQYNSGSVNGNFDGFVVYDIGNGKIEPSYEIQHATSQDIYSYCWYNAYLPARSFVFDSKLTTLLSHSVMSTDLTNGEHLWNITLDGKNNTDCAPYFINMPMF